MLRSLVLSVVLLCASDTLDRTFKQPQSVGTRDLGNPSGNHDDEIRTNKE